MKVGRCTTLQIYALCKILRGRVEGSIFQCSSEKTTQKPKRSITFDIILLRYESEHWTVCAVCLVERVQLYTLCPVEVGPDDELQQRNVWSGPWHLLLDINPPLTLHCGQCSSAQPRVYRAESIVLSNGQNHPGRRTKIRRTILVLRAG